MKLPQPKLLPPPLCHPPFCLDSTPLVRFPKVYPLLPSITECHFDWQTAKMAVSTSAKLLKLIIRNDAMKEEYACRRPFRSFLLTFFLVPWRSTDGVSLSWSGQVSLQPTQNNTEKTRPLTSLFYHSLVGTLRTLFCVIQVAKELIASAACCLAGSKCLDRRNEQARVGLTSKL